MGLYSESIARFTSMGGRHRTMTATFLELLVNINSNVREHRHE